MQSCKFCGCTEQHACIDDRGERDNCHWAAENVCSYCSDAIKQLMPVLQKIIDMRNMQKHYFKSRKQSILDEAKKREKAVDAILKEIAP